MIPALLLALHAFVAGAPDASLYEPDRTMLPTPVAWSWLSPSSWFDGKYHRGTGKVYVRLDRNKLARGMLYLDDVDMKLSTTGMIVRSPGMISLRSAVPGMFHDWHPTVYCKIIVHPDEITVVDVQFNGKIERREDGTLVTRPTCKCLIQSIKDKSSDSREIPTCE